MPYLQEPWSPQRFRAGDWMPEMDVTGWESRHAGLEGDFWVQEAGPTPEQVDQYQSASLGDELKGKLLVTLGADIGSAQRDAYFYANFLEQLKQAAPVSGN